MMNWGTALRASIILLIGAGLTIILILRSPQKESIERDVVLSRAPEHTPNESFANEEETNDELPTHQSSPAPVVQPGAPRPNSSFIPPSSDQARSEVKENNHAAPKSLIQFANQIADRFDEVERSPDQADSFMSELEDCVKDGTQPMMSARALCLTNAEDLAAMFPQFKARFTQLKRDAPSEVLDLSRATLGMDQGFGP
jgi:hypothetical protein